ncbi:MAG: hypothetical protein KA717_03490 [Woronichinia naegeliana WA131]|jgi:hypothetical protein|uniref:Uncharacterized protein n=1 Tax=Woronichinia naegeliana WA131 TaxID=2824559 RepID=A0A977KY10_9CYAN|nr:MAG: hypothetical protein KA717_03490 [Woronichinia naegeliana WA131]
MRLKGVGLGLLLLLCWTSIGRSDSPGFRSSLSITLEQLNRLKKEFKVTPPSTFAEPLENFNSSSSLTDLDKSQLVQEVLSQNQSQVQSPQSKPTVIQSLYVKPEGIFIYLTGDDPVVVMDSQKEPGTIHLSLQATRLDPYFKLPQNTKQAESFVESVQVNQIDSEPSISKGTTATSVEIIIKTDHKNWQAIPRQSGLILSAIQDPPTAEMQASNPASTIEQALPQSSPVVNEATLPPQPQPGIEAESPMAAMPVNPTPAEITQTFPESIPLPSPDNSVEKPIEQPVTPEPTVVPTSPTVNEAVPLASPESSLDGSVTPEKTAEDNVPIEPVPEAIAPVIETPLARQPIRLLHLNTANQLKAGESIASYGETQTIQGGYGTGNQTYFTYSDWGLTDDLQIGWAYMLNDDPTYLPINGVNIDQQYQSMGPNIKYRFYQDDNWSLGILGALEQFQIYSGPGLYNNQESPTVSNTLAGTIQVPISYDLSKEFQVTLTPSVNIFSNNLNGVPFFGTIFNVGAGASWQIFDNLSVFANTTVPLGSGNNALNTSRQLFRKVLWSVGGTLAYNKEIAIELHLTNSFGGTPTTGILTLPTASNEVLLGGSFIMVPSAKEKRTDIVLSDRNQKLSFDWFTLTTPYILPTDDYGLRLAGDSGGSIGGGIFYSFLQDFQVEAIVSSIGGFDTQSVLGEAQGTNTQWRAGGKLVILNQLDGDPFSISGRLTFGRDFGNKQGYMMVEYPMMYEFNEQWAALFSPKAAINGGNTPVGLGFGINYQIIPELQMIGEVTPIITGERTVWAAGFRIFPIKNIAIDLLGTNSTSQFDLGELIAEPGTRFSASIQWYR